MPDLEDRPVEAWFDALRPGDGPPAPVRAVELDAGVSARLADLGRALDDAAAADAAALSLALQADALRSDLQAILAQLGAARVLRVLTWLGEAELPECERALAALLADGGAAGAALRSALAAVSAQVALHRMFSPGRVAALRAATQAAFEETPA